MRCLGLTLALLVTALVHGQAPTPDQMEAFRNLPPDQQRSVLQALGESRDGVTRRDPQLTPTPAVSSPGTAAEKTPEPSEPPRIESGATLLLDVKLDEKLRVDEATRRLLQSRRDRLAAGNPYVMDDQGRLNLPLLAPINVRGLTDEQASQRLNADPRLAGLQFVVMLLPVEPVEAAALKPFGYDIFGESPATFAPVTDVPVPTDYRLGPGDNVNIELFGNRSGRYLLVVNRDGMLTIPDFGPVQVTGFSFDQVRNEIDRRVSEKMIGVRASVSMGELRSIRIFVVGDVNRPGAYTVSGLSTITNALFASGGVAEIGSLRNIELKRGGSTVTRLDLYDLLLHGDTSKDLGLQQGDAIFIPPLGSTAAISGEILRPAIYEFRGETTVGELVRLAGGLRPQADARSVRLERIDANHERTVLDLDITAAAGLNQRLRAGDVLTIPRVLDDTRGVVLEGHAQRPGKYAWSAGMRLTDLLGSLQMLKLNADQRYILIRRESPDRRIEVLSADALRAFERPGTDADPLLQSRDRVIVFSRDADRGQAVADLLREIRLQTRDNQALPIVTITGRVRAPGDYPLERGMTIDDLVRAGGGLDEAAHTVGAELTRYELADNQARKTEVIDVQLSAAGASEGVALRPYDVLVVKETPDWREQESITLLGEVRFPGTYPIRKNETLSSVVARAGGLTDDAFPAGGVFTREEIKQQERQNIDGLTQRLRSDLALLALQGGAQPTAQRQNVSETLAAGQSLLAQLQSAEPTGRLVINLADALRMKGGESDIELRGGDRLIVPRLKQYVTVIGEVQNPTTHVYKQRLDREDYIQLSGGTTSRADTKRIYVVRANGTVVPTSGGAWFSRGSGASLESGDTVVVPIDAERMRPLPLWTAVTTVIYNLAVAVAAIGSL